ASSYRVGRSSSAGSGTTSPTCPSELRLARWRSKGTARSWAGPSPPSRPDPFGISSSLQARGTARPSPRNSHRPSESRSRKSLARCLREVSKSSNNTASRPRAPRSGQEALYIRAPLRSGRVFGGRMSQANAVVVQLPDDERPTRWYNIQADLPEPLSPPKDPATGPSRIKALADLLSCE